jgi:hypothetical protein
MDSADLRGIIREVEPDDLKNARQFFLSGICGRRQAQTADLLCCHFSLRIDSYQFFTGANPNGSTKIPRDLKFPHSISK